MHKHRCHCKSVLAFSNPLTKTWRKLRWLIRWSESNNRSPAKSSHYKSDQIMVSITTFSNDITAAELRKCRQQREEQREAQQRCAGLAGNDDIRAEVKCMHKIPTGLNSSLCHWDRYHHPPSCACLGIYSCVHFFPLANAGIKWRNITMVSHLVHGSKVVLLNELRPRKSERVACLMCAKLWCTECRTLVFKMARFKGTVCHIESLFSMEWNRKCTWRL